MPIDPTTGKEIPLVINREDKGTTQLVQNPNQPNNMMAGLTVPPPTSTTIKTDTLGTNPLQLPTYAPPATPAFPTTQPPTVDEQAKQFAETKTPVPTQAETQQTGLMSRFQSLQEKLFGKSTAQTQQEQAQGIPQKTQAVTDIQSQINQLQNEANTAKIQAQTMGETTSFGNAQIAQIERDRTVKALQLNSFLYAAQGNLATAQMMADKAITAEFAPAEAEIAYIREALQMNDKIFSREDKKRADQLQITLNERERLLNEQKADKATSISWAAAAMKNGATPLQAQAIAQAKDLQSAFSLYAPFAQDSNATQKAVLDLQYQRLQNQKLTAENALANSKNPIEIAQAKANLAKSNAEILKIQKETGAINAGGNYVPGSNPTVDNWAKLIISGQSKITDVPNPKGSTMRSDVINAIANSDQMLLSDKDREKLGVLQNAKNVVQTLKDLHSGIAPSNAFSRLYGGPLNYLSAVFQTNDQTAAYRDARAGFVSNIARTLGEKGALAEGDVSRAMANIPALGDTVSLSETKFKVLQDILDKAGEAIIKTSTEPLNKLTGNKLTNPDGTQEVNISDLTPAQIQEAKSAGWK